MFNRTSILFHQNIENYTFLSALFFLKIFVQVNKMVVSQRWLIFVCLVLSHFVWVFADEEEPKIIIDARPTKWHECECGRCGQLSKYYDGIGKTRMWRCLDVASVKCFVRSQAIRVKCPHCGVVARKVPQVWTW